jgi:hypothetical protein
LQGRPHTGSLEQRLACHPGQQAETTRLHARNDLPRTSALCVSAVSSEGTRSRSTSSRRRVERAANVHLALTRHHWGSDRLRRRRFGGSAPRSR